MSSRRSCVLTIQQAIGVVLGQRVLDVLYTPYHITFGYLIHIKNLYHRLVGIVPTQL